MIRFRFGLGILAIILATGIATTGFMIHVHKDICCDLEKASQPAALEQAEAYICRAQKNWERHRHWVAVLADHGDMDEIDSLFRQLEVYQKTQDSQACAAICAELAYRVEALGGSHNISWWNLL